MAIKIFAQHLIRAFLPLLLTCALHTAKAEQFGVIQDSYVPIAVDDITIFIKVAADIRSTEVVNITSNSATINWQTKINATTELHYSTSSDLSGAVLAPGGGDSTADKVMHAVDLTSLSPATAYYYQIMSRDSSGNYAAGLVGTFNTLPVPASEGEIINTSNGPYYIPHDTGTSTVPYWVTYLKSNMDTTHSIQYCLQTTFSGLCSIESPPEVHRRRTMGNWIPFYGPSSGNRPGYYLRNPVNGNIEATYYTLWYLQTDELAIDFDYMMPGCLQCNFQKERTIWPGEVYTDRNGNWGLVPMESDVRNTAWMAIIPKGKVWGQNGIGWRNWPVSVPQMLIAGGGDSPRVGSIISNRATVVQEGDLRRIYISGVFTGGGLVTNDINDFITSVNQLNGEPVGNFTVNKLINYIELTRFNHPNARFEVYGHSLGAADAIVLYNKGYLKSSDKVVAYAPPAEINVLALLPTAGMAQLIAYCGVNDYVCNASDKGVTAERNNAGASIIEIDTGLGGLESHNRCRYQYAEIHNGVANTDVPPLCRW